ncbi:hypothetical protein E2C00_00345 [Streptomyces sp. WAC05374]|uniref:peptidase inhibitor family I36 protein n=1 Tax=Streptomyces sp. WAC05374 TaxID=2487420 RepID=UPI000F868CEF|nr:peptidase inhibitor family I36 protein [Streptomyces sp. WAC05374]RST19626.1 hypothetical protein EF905_00600 [Streptomyces sp. WAC05374]TDF50037.1 hypothetical protein E2B92_00320 [Streptomyces sp. WAC05374]TDF57763.1 hypothetical protein E2C02_08110 [Streptomyces sp. WAC05374]TDF60291.1 hypothetical protein E2C00_00345 [Streptomyces sp. WAC05374]
MTVTVYAGPDYKGKSATLGKGRHKLDPSMNDCISSVRVPAGWTVTLFENADFTGEQVSLKDDTPKLEGALHDKASSIVIAETEVTFDEPRPLYVSRPGDEYDASWFKFED